MHSGMSINRRLSLLWSLLQLYVQLGTTANSFESDCTFHEYFVDPNFGLLLSCAHVFASKLLVTWIIFCQYLVFLYINVFNCTVYLVMLLNTGQCYASIVCTMAASVMSVTLVHFGKWLPASFLF